jgi:hypothetical protein
MKNAVLIWKGLSPENLPGHLSFEEWSPPEHWIEQKSILEQSSSTSYNRPGASALRVQVLDAYQNTCAITGTQTKEVLEVAHIVPYFGEQSDVLPNCLLLRADIHALFDSGLLRISYAQQQREFIGKLHDQVLEDYGDYHERPLQVPEDRKSWPSKEALLIKQDLHKIFWQVI